VISSIPVPHRIKPSARDKAEEFLRPFLLGRQDGSFQDLAPDK